MYFFHEKYLKFNAQVFFRDVLCSCNHHTIYKVSYSSLPVRASGDITVFSRNVTQAERVVGVACEVLSSLIHNVTYYSRLAVSNAAMETQTVVASTNGSESKHL